MGQDEEWATTWHSDLQCGGISPNRVTHSKNSVLVKHSIGFCNVVILVEAELESLFFLSENKPTFLFFALLLYIAISFKLKYSPQERRGGS